MKKNIKSLLAIAIIFLASVTSIFAQREETVLGSSGFGFSGAWGGFTGNIGQFDGKTANYGGGMWALEFGKRFFIGNANYSTGYQALPSSTKTFSLNSSNLLLGYTHNSYLPIHPIFSLGVGGAKLRVRTDGVIAEQNVLTLDPTIGAEANLTRWCHVDAQLGYRAVMNSNSVGLKDKDFSGLYGQVNLKFGYSWGRYKTKKIASERE
jgi:hypothetical protein